MPRFKIVSKSVDTRRSPREEGVNCVDLVSGLPKDTAVFYDDCHFNTSGCEKTARILTDFLIDRLAG